MYIIVAPIQIKPGFKEQFVREMIGDAQGSVTNEPGCLRFDIVQDGNDPNRIWLYEVYVDEAAFQEHMKAPHFIKWRDAVKDWRDDSVKLTGAGSNARNIWPTDADWPDAKRRTTRRRTSR
jgi:autoinducer 2-degrading protein